MVSKTSQPFCVSIDADPCVSTDLLERGFSTNVLLRNIFSPGKLVQTCSFLW